MLVDNVNGQYNSFFLSLLIFSVDALLKGQILVSALFISVMATFRHVALYFAFVYIVYFFSVYCLTLDNDKLRFLWRNFLKLGAVVLGTGIIAVYPFRNSLNLMLFKISGGNHKPLHSSSVPSLNLIFSIIEFPFTGTITRAYPIPTALRIPLLAGSYFILWRLLRRNLKPILFPTFMFFSGLIFFNFMNNSH